MNIFNDLLICLGMCLVTGRRQRKDRKVIFGLWYTHSTGNILGIQKLIFAKKKIDTEQQFDFVFRLN